MLTKINIAWVRLVMWLIGSREFWESLKGKRIRIVDSRLWIEVRGPGDEE